MQHKFKLIEISDLKTGKKGLQNLAIIKEHERPKKGDKCALYLFKCWWVYTVVLVQGNIVWFEETNDTGSLEQLHKVYFIHEQILDENPLKRTLLIFEERGRTHLIGQKDIDDILDKNSGKLWFNMQQNEMNKEWGIYKNSDGFHYATIDKELLNETDICY